MGALHLRLNCVPRVFLVVRQLSFMEAFCKNETKLCLRNSLGSFINDPIVLIHSLEVSDHEIHES